MDMNILAFLLLAFFVLFSYKQVLNKKMHPNINSQVYKQFLNWKRQFSMSFPGQQERYRLRIFAQNINKIKIHNSVKSRTYDLGINQFAHLKESQFIGILIGNQNFDNNNMRHQKIDKSYMNIGNMVDVDWQTLGKVSQIKNQGNCNAGYAFSTTSLIQSSLMMQNKNVLLSQQQIIDCAGEYQSQGCNGGSRIGSLRYAQEKGLATQNQYPYLGLKCECHIQNGSFKPDFTIIQSLGCESIKQNIYKSPITLAVNAKTWQLYSNGVFNNCPSTSQVNHQIYLVGVTLSYWRLKNSWGSRWGEYGYIRIKLGNNCGICERQGYGFTL